MGDLFKCFLEENADTSSCQWYHFVDKFYLFPSVILLSTSSLDESWEAPSPSVVPLSTASLHDLCKNSLKFDNSMQYWGPLWHIVFILLIFLNKFLFTSSPLLYSIQVGMIWERSVLPCWHAGSLHKFIGCLVTGEEALQKSVYNTSDRLLCIALGIATAKSPIICGLKLFVNKIWGQKSYYVVGNM